MRSDTGTKLVKFFNEEARGHNTSVSCCVVLRCVCLLLTAGRAAGAAELCQPFCSLSDTHARAHAAPGIPALPSSVHHIRVFAPISPQDERWHVHGVFHRFVATGEPVAIDRAVAHTYAPVYAGQTGMTFQVFSTDDPEPVRLCCFGAVVVGVLRSI